MKPITPLNNHGSITIHFQYQGKTYKFSPIKRGKYDDPVALGKAKSICQQIELDIVNGNFDSTLEKYKPRLEPISIKGRTPKDAQSDLESAIEEYKRRCISLELWDKYVEFKRPSASASTIAKDYKTVRSHLSKCPKIKASDGLILADEFRDYLLRTTTPAAAKKVLTQVSACCDWAVDERGLLLRENPFAGMSKKIKLPNSEKQKEIEAFTPEEQRAIIEAFKNDKFCSKGDRFKHSKYANYVEFMFMCGCRPSEAIALQWKHVSSDFKTIKFEQALVEGEHGRVLQDGLKTQASRTVNTGQSLQNLLRSIKPETCDPESLVFPSPQGGYIDTHNFCNRQWKKVLERLKIPYRDPYTTRRTLIAKALNSGMDAKDVAGLVGNSPKMIYNNYAAKNKDATLPD